jgi:hypothetical protein
MKYIAYLFFLGIWLPAILPAQERSKIQYGDVTIRDFELPKSPVIEPGASGVILFDIGSSKFKGNKNGWFSTVYKRHTRIKIINAKAYDDLGTFKFILYGKGLRKDKVEELKATVYNIENGKLVTSTVGKESLFEEKISPYRHENKLALPLLKEGSIIEYTYTVTSYYYIRSWMFQYLEYPCLYSEYEVVLPDLLSFTKIRFGTQPFFINKEAKIKNSRYFVGNDVEVYSDDNTQLWVMKDIPGFKREKFINSPYNYLERVELYLTRFSNGEDIYGNVSWNKTIDNLIVASDFGGAVHPDNVVFLANTVDKVTEADQNLLESSRKLFYYVRDNFVCLPDDDIYIEDNLFRINKNKKGNVAEINLLLTGLLRQKGISADPVILSTKSSGVNSPDFPLLYKMNYVICMMRLNGDTIYLDATNRELGFGRLSQECYNGHARVVNLTGAPVYFDADKIKESKVTRVFILNDGNKKLKGAVETEYGFFGTEELRNEVKETGKDEFLDELKLSDDDNVLQLFNARIDSLNNPEHPARLHYDFSREVDEDILYFTPVIAGYKENPFKSTERKYPITMPYPMDELYTLNMEIPTGYVADELPKSVKVAFNENEGLFEYVVQKSETAIQLRTRVRLKNAVFAADEYTALRDFFSFIIKKQSEQIVFRKKK